MGKILFIASTYAQLINAITLCKTEFVDKQCDMYYLPNISSHIDRLRNKACFQNYYRMPLIKSTLRIHSKTDRVKCFADVVLHWKKISNALPSEPLDYDRVLIPGVALAYFLVYYAIDRKNPAINLSLYEEGICEYYTLGSINWKKKMFHKLLFGKYYYEKCDSLYVHCPEAVDNIWGNIKVKSIVSPEHVIGLSGLLREVFEYHEINPVFSKKYVFIDDCYYGSKKRLEKEKQQGKMLKTIASIVGKENIIIKLHPKSSEKKYGSKYRYVKSHLPMELIAMNESVENKVFISLVSSSIVNFKLVLNKEPCVIVLQRLIDKKNNSESASNKVFYFAQKAYKEKWKFFIPEDEQELIDWLNKLVLRI